MTEILGVVLSQLHESYRLPIRAEIDVHNLDSIRLCESLGFKQLNVVDGYIVMEINGI